MRIAFLANADNIHTKRWAEFLVSRGHKLFVLCDPPVKNPPNGAIVLHPEMRLVTKVLAFRLFPKPFGNNFYKRFPYKRAVRSIKPDIVHGFEALGYGYALAHCGPYPKVLTPWGNDILYDPKRSRIARFLVTRALRSANIITTNFLELKNRLTQDFNIPESKIRPFSWGVNPDIFHPGYTEETRRLKQEINIPENARIILSPRMMKPYWGIDVIAKALPQVMRKVPDVYAVFLRGAGEEAFEKEIKTSLKNAGCFKSARFITRYLSPAEVAAYYNLSDVFVSCPKSDLLSISVLEGMACGCAPLLAELESYKMRVTHGKNGLFFHPGNSQDLSEKLADFFRHPEWKTTFARYNIAQTLEKDNWKKNALQLERIYHELIKNP